MGKRFAEFVRSDTGILVLLAMLRVVLHCLSNGQYGFHRDELQTLDDARHLDWGFVAYPPITPLIGRLELALFGTSLIGFRFLAAVAVSAVMILAGLITKELGGGRREQILAAIAVGISPISLPQGAVLQYVAFDYLWGVAVTYFLVRLGIWDYRFMLRSFRYAIVIIFILAAILTPTPDVVNQSLLALPMLVLYILSIGVAYVWRRKQ